MANELVLVGFYFLTLIYSIIIHEVSHGWMALWLGDLTAKYAGRLSLNPVKHVDPVGSIIVPITLFLLTGMSFGWAKPVPYNPYNLRNQKWGPSLVALAGPLSNITLALVAILVGRLLPISLAMRGDIFMRFAGVLSGQGGFLSRWSLFADSLGGSVTYVVFGLCLLAVFWNVLLAFFNLIPIPPLDGSKILYSVFSFRTETVMFIERYGFLILFAVVFLFPAPISFVLDAALNFFFGMMI
ncbi:MAG TPA: site-2 protease family protein [Candidatus Fimivivens sp.]|nr:site-2 protease family protein [Candidatus Fimivivens sp.]